MHNNTYLQFSRSVRYVLFCLLIISISSCTTGNKPVYQLNISSNPPEGGSVSPASGEYDEGMEVEIAATPNGNWLFVEWQGDHSGSQNPDTVTIDSDKSVTALFQIAELSDDQFTGTYAFTQLEPSSSVAGEFSEGWLFDESQVFTAELHLNPASSPNGRIFTASPLPEFGEFETDFPILFEIEQHPDSNAVTLETEVSIELYCDDDESIMYGPATMSNAGSFDVNDDSEFTLVISDNSNSKCDLGPDDITFQATKVGSKIADKQLNLAKPFEDQSGKKNQMRREIPNVD